MSLTTRELAKVITQKTKSDPYPLGSHGYFNAITDGGIKNNGEDQALRLQGIIDGNPRRPIFFPPGIYRANSVVNYGSNTVLLAEPGTVSFVSSLSSGSVFAATSVSDIMLKGFNFDLTNSAVVALKCKGVAGSRIKENKVTLGKLVAYESLADNVYGLSNIDNSDIIIDSNVCKSTDTTTLGNVAIYISYAEDFVIAKNQVDGYGQCIMWWGGDANTDGALTNARKCKNGVIGLNRVGGSGAGGIWGSMGDEIAVGINHITRCGDIGLDFEGCTACSGVGNVISYCFSNMATFFRSVGILFADNTSLCDSTHTNHLLIKNATGDGTLTGNRDISIRGGTFTATSGLARIYAETAQRISITGAKFTNSKIEAAPFASVVPTNRWEVENNEFDYTILQGAAFNAIDLSTLALGGCNGLITVKNNKVISTIGTQPAGSRPINVGSNDPTQVPFIVVDENISFFMPAPPRLWWASANSALTGSYHARGNIGGGAGVPVIDNTGAASPTTLNTTYNNVA